MTPRSKTKNQDPKTHCNRRPKGSGPSLKLDPNRKPPGQATRGQFEPCIVVTFFLFNLIHCCKAAIEHRYQSSMSRFRYRASPPIERQGNLTCVYHLANAGSVTSIDWLTASEAFNVVHLRSAATMYCDALKYLSRPADCARGDQHSHVYNECSQHISTQVQRAERKMTAETCALILGPEQ